MVRPMTDSLAPRRLALHPGPEFRRLWNAHGMIVIAMALYGLAWEIVKTSYGTPRSISYFNTFVIFGAVVPTLLTGGILGRLVWYATVERPQSVIGAIWRDARQYRRLANGLTAMLLLVSFIWQFTQFKAAIPDVIPFRYDPEFMALDRALHFGRLPQEWLSFLLDWPWLIATLNVVYNCWFLFMWGAVFAASFQLEDSFGRRHFLICFLLLWMLAGTAMAMLLSSAGPCFYGRLFPALADPYGGLMARLHDINTHWPVWALFVQDQIWQAYVNRTDLTSISAMPSMHNATCLILALAGFRVNRWLGGLAAAYAATIFISSLMLGWHYAADSYVGWSLAILIWHATKPLARFDFFPSPATEVELP